MAYQLEKWVWSDADFEQMGWHDARVYAVQFGQDIRFDIDYIFEWVQADKDDFFSFLVAPATLVFPEYTNVTFACEIRLNLEIEIEDIHRRISATGATEWHIETHQGDIIITADSFYQVIRRPPTLQTGQQLLPEERGAPSFSLVPDLAFTESQEVTEVKEAEFSLRRKATEIRQLQRKLELLVEQRSIGALDVKRYLLTKRETEAKIKHLRNELKGAQY